MTQTQKLTPITGRPSKRGDFFGFRLHDEDASRFRAEAARRQVSMSDLAREGLMHALNTHTPTQNQPTVS